MDWSQHDQLLEVVAATCCSRRIDPKRSASLVASGLAASTQTLLERLARAGSLLVSETNDADVARLLYLQLAKSDSVTLNSDKAVTFDAITITPVGCSVASHLAMV